MDFDQATSMILNRALQPSTAINCRPQSNLNRIVQSQETRLATMEEQLRQAKDEVENLKVEMRSAQDKLMGKASQLQARLLTVVNGRFEDLIKKRMDDTKRRYCECQARANELEYDLGGVSRSFKKFAERLEELENSVGMYSGKERMM